MDDLHPNLQAFRRGYAAERRAQVAPLHPGRLGQTLREARQDSGIELEDLAEKTHIRLSHLEALEAGQLTKLPGDPHGKTFVRRYAQAVGLDPARALLFYAQERRLSAQAEPTGLELPLENGVALADHPQLGRFARLFASLLLVALASWLALRVFDNALIPGSGSVQNPAVQGSAVQGSATVPLTETSSVTHVPPPVTPTMILLSLQTTPPGAEVSIDGYHLGQSPLVDAPVRAGKRVVRVERGGYGTFERALDLAQDRRLNVTLFPGSAEKPTVTGIRTEVPTEASAEVPARAGAGTPAAQVVITVTAEAWLEVYRGNARGAGERLVYETAEPGGVYSFSAPVYIFSGNAGGVLVAKGDASAQPLGTSGALVGRPY